MGMSEAGEPVALLISPVEEDHNTLQQLFQQHGWNLRDEISGFRINLPKGKRVSVVITERELAVGNWKDVLNAIHVCVNHPGSLSFPALRTIACGRKP